MIQDLFGNLQTLRLLCIMKSNGYAVVGGMGYSQSPFCHKLALEGRNAQALHSFSVKYR